MHQFDFCCWGFADPIPTGGARNASQTQLYLRGQLLRGGRRRADRRKRKRELERRKGGKKGGGGTHESVKSQIAYIKYYIEYYIKYADHKGVPRRQPHRRSSLATLPSMGAVPQSPHIIIGQGTCCVLCSCLLIVCLICLCTMCSFSTFRYCWLGLLTCKSRLPYNLYCVGEDVKHCSIQCRLQKQS